MDAVATQIALLASAVAASLLHILRGGHSPLAKYLLAWACFHTSEYWCTRRYLPRTVTPYLFLIWGARGSVQLAAVHLASIIEYVVTQKYWHYHGLQIWGLAVAIAGILARARAIADCGDSFSHYIETDTPRQLVTSGIYAWCRHPSYAGFLLYVVGMQLVLGNIFTHVVSLGVLSYFFTQRIQIEEYFLINRFYGAQYVQYKAHTAALIPYIY